MKVIYFPNQPHSFAFGGFEYQMLNAFKSVQLTNEVEVEKFNLWERSINYDLIHLWGITEHNYKIIDYCGKNKKKIFASVLLPYYSTVKEIISHKIYSVYPGIYKKTLNYFNKIDHFSVVNELQLEVLNKIYKIPKNKISIIPNIVDANYYNQESFSNQDSSKKYAITTGSVCRRKNQLDLAKKFENLKYNLIIIGSVIDGEEDYGNKVEEFVFKSKYIKWVKSLENTDTKYLEYYHNSSFFILGSKIETQPISILEAMVSKKPVIIIDCAYSKQSVFSDLIKISEISEKEIQGAITKIQNRIEYEKKLLDQFKIEKVGQLYKNAYFDISNKYKNQ